MSAIVMLSHHSVESLHLGHVTPNGAFGLAPSAHYPPCPLVAHDTQSTMMTAEAV